MVLQKMKWSLRSARRDERVEPPACARGSARGARRYPFATRYGKVTVEALASGSLFSSNRLLGDATGFRASRDGKELVLAGQKSGTVWALNPDDGSLVWRRDIGTGGPNGGVESSFFPITATFFVLSRTPRSYHA